jgi:hypothetical protein
MISMTSTGKSGVVESWVPNLRLKLRPKRDFLPRKLLRECLKSHDYVFLV